MPVPICAGWFLGKVIIQMAAKAGPFESNVFFQSVRQGRIPVLGATQTIMVSFEILLSIVVAMILTPYARG